LAAGLCPDPLGELTALPQILSLDLGGEKKGRKEKVGRVGKGGNGR